MIPPLSLEEFINRANNIHNNKYDYSLVVYKNIHTKVKIKCLKHGIFEQRPYSHIKGDGCPKCAGNKKLTIEEFIKKANIVHNNRYNYDNAIYRGAHENIIIGCPVHGDYITTPYSHLHIVGCRICKNAELFFAKSKLIHNNKYDYSKSNYISNKIKITIICPIHGEFKQTPNKHAEGCGCKKCVNNKFNTEWFIETARKMHGDLYDYSKVKYKSVKEKVIIICKIHGEFEQKPNHHFSGCGCSKCSKYKFNKFEKIIKKIVEDITGEIFAINLKMDWIINPKTGRKLELDLYCEKLKIAIECNGPQHYKNVDYLPSKKNTLENQQYRDSIKIIECKKKGVDLIEIKYPNDHMINKNIKKIRVFLEQRLKPKKI